MSKKIKEEEIIKRLKAILSSKRYQHSLGVRDTAVKLAQLYGVDLGKASLAGLVHDWAKDLTDELLLKKAEQFGILVDNICLVCPNLLHGPVGAELISRELGIQDQEIREAVAQHTMGSEKMSTLAKIIFVADYIEPNRNYPGIDRLRKIAFKKLDLAVLMAAEQTIKYLLEKKEIIHPQTVLTRNAFLILSDENECRR